MALNISSIALRSIPGAFILNSGLGKLKLDRDSAAGLQGKAATGVPAVQDLEPEKFGKAVAYGEIAVGATLLAPFVNDRVAGVVLGGFSAAMLSMYFRDDQMTESDGIRPSGDGIALAKDAWLAAIALGLVTRRKG